MGAVQDKAEERVRAQEARAEAQRKAKEGDQAEWRRQQHERELARRRASSLLCCDDCCLCAAWCLCGCRLGCICTHWCMGLVLCPASIGGLCKLEVCPGGAQDLI